MVSVFSSCRHINNKAFSPPGSRASLFLHYGIYWIFFFYNQSLRIKEKKSGEDVINVIRNLITLRREKLCSTSMWNCPYEMPVIQYPKRCIEDHSSSGTEAKRWADRNAFTQRRWVMLNVWRPSQAERVAQCPAQEDLFTLQIVD